MGEPAMAPASQEEVPQVAGGTATNGDLKIAAGTGIASANMSFAAPTGFALGPGGGKSPNSDASGLAGTGYGSGGLAAYHIPQTKLAALAQRARQSLSGMHDAHSD